MVRAKKPSPSSTEGETVSDLCEIGPKIVRIDHLENQSRIEAPGQASLVPASNGERQVKASDRLEGHCHIPDQAGNSEFVESDNVVDDSFFSTVQECGTAQTRMKKQQHQI